MAQVKVKCPHVTSRILLHRLKKIFEREKKKQITPKGQKWRLYQQLSGEKLEVKNKSLIAYKAKLRYNRR